jgi:hypothetical protein
VLYHSNVTRGPGNPSRAIKRKKERKKEKKKDKKKEIERKKAQARVIWNFADSV